MTLADLRTQLQSLLNRSDCTDALATTFLVQSMQRIQRELRVPSMERLLVLQPTTPLSSIPIPDDLIQPIDLLVQNDGCWPGYDIGALVPMQHMTFRELQRIPALSLPRAYARYQAAFYIRGNIPAGVETHLYYYGEFSPFASDSDHRPLSG